MTPELIDERIKYYKDWMTQLEAQHEKTVREYQQIVLNNQNSFQNIKGALEELQFLKSKFNGVTE